MKERTLSVRESERIAYCRPGLNICNVKDLCIFTARKKKILFYFFVVWVGGQFDPWIPTLPEVNVGEGVQLGYPLDVLNPQQQADQLR